MSADHHVVVDGRLRCQEWLERAQLERCASAPRTFLVVSVACLHVTDLNYANRQCKLVTKAPSTRQRHHTVRLSPTHGARVMLSRQQSTSPLSLGYNKRFRLYAPYPAAKTRMLRIPRSYFLKLDGKAKHGLLSISRPARTEGHARARPPSRARAKFASVPSGYCNAPPP